MKIETERLILRNFEMEDAPSLAQNINHPKIAYMTANIPYPYTLDLAKEYIRKDIIESRKENRSNYRFAIQLKQEKDIIGSIGLHKVDFGNGKADIGYWLAVDYHEKGIMTESEKSILDYAFNDLKLHKITGSALAVNKGSNRLFEKFNFRQVGTLKEDKLKLGQRIDVNLWELLNTDFIGKKI